ncbi:uncharacterized protein LOC132601557 [Lycium barbarum]|uniref:uncharacterized protein LOC132601557 n=1 Tax=Lycium barbarum TaxID=112863 RepID=UPI00293EBF72|nr:uncharacterized protein LOC132601557 [Lycium barbarum]
MDKVLTKFNCSQPSSSMDANRSQLIDVLNLGSLEADPGERIPITKYNPRIQDEVRRHYIQTGPCEPLLKKFPTTQIGNRGRQFVSSWYKGPHSNCLEYSMKKDAAYCLYIVHACAKETVKAIIGDLNGDYFGILVDESKDISHKEQMTLVLQYVDNNAIAKKHEDVEDFFDHVTNVLNVVGRSFKRRDLICHHQAEKLEQLPESGEVHTRRGLNQTRGLQRPGDTRWGSHFKTLDNFIIIFSTIVHVLEVIKHEGSTLSDRNQAKYLLTEIKTFKFVFVLHLMLKVMAMSNELSKILQKKGSRYY